MRLHGKNKKKALLITTLSLPPSVSPRPLGPGASDLVSRVQRWFGVTEGGSSMPNDNGVGRERDTKRSGCQVFLVGHSRGCKHVVLAAQSLLLDGVSLPPLAHAQQRECAPKRRKVSEREGWGRASTRARARERCVRTRRLSLTQVLSAGKRLSLFTPTPTHPPTHT
jgi:hypothetical protein